MKIRFIQGIVIFLGLFFLGGCVQKTPSKPKVFESIIIKNSTGMHLQRVSVSELTLNEKGRSGSISPVPRGASQIYKRGDKAPRLPSRLKLSWIDYNNALYTDTISTEEALISASQDKTADIVLELLPGGEVKVYTELKE